MSCFERVRELLLVVSESKIIHGEVIAGSNFESFSFNSYTRFELENMQGDEGPNFP